MKCKIFFDEESCTEIETRKCLANGHTSIKYELCMIALTERLNQNTTQFCVNHYNNLPIWTEKVDPKYLQYSLRKHLCYFNTGVPYGREYCDDYFDKSDGKCHIYLSTECEFCKLGNCNSFATKGKMLKLLLNHNDYFEDDCKASCMKKRPLF